MGQDIEKQINQLN
ncbi:Protein of unknown function [Bacillus cereus]|nr:Protein of unknown function [Bacillus cereus]